MSLGVNLNDAINVGVGSKGPYTMSRTPITQMAMANTWLTAQLRDLAGQGDFRVPELLQITDHFHHAIDGFGQALG